MTTGKDTPLPVSFRAELLSQLMPCLRAGECCSLMGVSGVGKSNLAQFLCRRDVQQAYWRDEPILVVLIDAHGMVFRDQPDECGLVELMIHRLIMEAESRAFSADLIGWASDLHRQLVGQSSVLLAMRYLERICARFCREQDYQVIFVFDQFEDLWVRLEGQFFLNLRNLRDQFKYRLIYLAITRSQLQLTRPDAQAVEAFWELFSAHTYGLGIYSEQDALLMIERVALRRRVIVTDKLRQTVLSYSGCHPSLLRAVFWELCRGTESVDNSAALLQSPAVIEECVKIWNDLSLSEQQVVRGLVAGQEAIPRDDRLLGDLRLKQIIVGEPPALFSPIFAAYARQHIMATGAGIVVNLRLRQVWVDGQPLSESLSPLEFTMLSYLARNAGRVCSREEILRELYKDETLDVNDQRLDTLLRRLREAIGDDARKPRHLITHRGVGIQLVQGEVRD